MLSFLQNSKHTSVLNANVSISGAGIKNYYYYEFSNAKPNAEKHLTFVITTKRDSAYSRGNCKAERLNQGRSTVKSCSSSGCHLRLFQKSVKPSRASY